MIYFKYNDCIYNLENCERIAKCSTGYIFDDARGVYPFQITFYYTGDYNVSINFEYELTMIDVWEKIINKIKLGE